jgi:hypothetical protein
LTEVLSSAGFRRFYINKFLYDGKIITDRVIAEKFQLRGNSSPMIVVRGLCSAALISALAACCLARSGPTPKLVLDGAKPIVFIGPRPPVANDEPDQGLWLRLVNNSVLSIEVGTMGTSTDPQLTLVSDEIVGRWTRIEESDAPEPKRPMGYALEHLAEIEVIQPGKALLFSVPITHVGRSWYMQIPFRLHLPPIKHGTQPLSYAQFALEDIPENLRGKLKK